MAKYNKSILLAPIADADQETTTSASGSLTLYVTGNAGGQTPMLALKKNGVASQRLLVTDEFKLTDGNGIADFTFDGQADASIAIELESANALEVGTNGLDLRDSISGARTFVNNVTLTSDLIANGNVTGDGSSVLSGFAALSGTAAAITANLQVGGDVNANGNIVGDGSTRVSGIQHFTASYAKIDVLDVNEINSVTRTESTLEVQDKLIIAGSGSDAAAAAGGGLQIGGTADGNAVASVLYDNANSALDFNIGTTTQVRLQDGLLRPETDNDVDLGASGAEFKDLHLDGIAYIDQLNADTLGSALDANNQAITNVDINSGAMDGVAIGAASASTAKFTTLEASGEASFSGSVRLGNNAASDLVHMNARVEGAINPSADNAHALGGGSLRYSQAHVVQLHADTLGQALDANGQDITNVSALEVDGVASFSSSLGVVGAAEFKGDVQVGEATSDTLTVTSRIASDLVPSTDSERALGSSGLQWSAVHVDMGHIDQLGSALDANTQNITNVGNFSALGGAITLGNAASDVISLAGQVSSSAGITTNELQVSSFAQVATYVGTANVYASNSVVLANGYAAGGSTIAANGNISAAGNLIAAGMSSSFGTATSAATVQFFGADQDGVEDGKERMEYMGRDNVLRFLDNDVEIMAIGGNDATDFAIDVHDNSGNQGKIRCTELVIHSDRNLKKDIKPMTDALDRVLKLQPVTYELKSNPGKADLGFIAQEVAQSVPEVCHFERGESRGLDYSRLSALLAGAVKSQQEQIDSLKAIVAKLQK